MSQPPSLPWWGTFACAGLGACIAEVVTLPIDTAKVRLQLQQRSAAGQAQTAQTAAPRVGMLGMVAKIGKEEGILALYKGFWPALHRQLVFASLRVGLYGQVRHARSLSWSLKKRMPIWSALPLHLVAG